MKLRFPLLATCAIAVFSCAQGESLTTPAGGTGGTVLGGDGGGGAPGDCPLAATDPTCNTCLQAQCKKECNGCATNTACTDLLACVQPCTDTACENTCKGQFPAGEAPLSAYIDSTSGCLGTKCSQQCSSGCTLTTQDAVCDPCFTTKCEAQCTTASGDANVKALLACYGTCTSGDTACTSACDTQNPQGAAILDTLNTCMQSQCATECGGGGGICDSGMTTNTPACDTCLGSYCCQETKSCVANTTCKACLTGATTSGCDTNTAYTSLNNCFINCDLECGG